VQELRSYVLLSGYGMKEMYVNEKNVFRVFELYEELLTLQMRDKIVPEYCSTLRGILNELDVHQSLVTDLWVLKMYCEDLAVLKILYGLDPSLVTQVCGQILGGDNMPSLSTAYSRILQVSIGFEPTATSISHTEHSAMTAIRDRGRGQGCRRDSGGRRGFFSWSWILLV